MSKPTKVPAEDAKKYPGEREMHTLHPGSMMDNLRLFHLGVQPDSVALFRGHWLQQQMRAADVALNPIVDCDL